MGAYGFAIRKAIKRANGCDCRNPAFGPALPPVGTWWPNMVRHTFATMVRKDPGLEAAQVMLGHARASTTEIYGERDESLAVSVAGIVG